MKKRRCITFCLYLAKRKRITNTEGKINMSAPNEVPPMPEWYERQKAQAALEAGRASLSSVSAPEIAPDADEQFLQAALASGHSVVSHMGRHTHNGGPVVFHPQYKYPLY